MMKKFSVGSSFGGQTKIGDLGIGGNFYLKKVFVKLFSLIMVYLP